MIKVHEICFLISKTNKIQVIDIFFSSGLH